MNGCLGLFKIACSLADKNGGVSETSSNPNVPVSDAKSTSNSAAVSTSDGCRASTKNTPVLWPPGEMAPLTLATALRALRASLFDIILSYPCFLQFQPARKPTFFSQPPLPSPRYTDGPLRVY